MVLPHVNKTEVHVISNLYDQYFLYIILIATDKYKQTKHGGGHNTDSFPVDVILKLTE